MVQLAREAEVGHDVVVLRSDAELTPAEAAEVIGMSQATLIDWRRKGIGPQWIRVSAKMVRYERAAIDRFLAERARGVA